VRTKGDTITGVRLLAAPLSTLPVRDRGPRAIQLSAANEGAPGVRFFNVPPRSLVEIMKPDGTLIRALQPTDSWSVSWDVMSESRTPVAAGLYRAQITGRDPTGRPFAAQLLYFGIARPRGD
jgi:hypothetical protein